MLQHMQLQPLPTSRRAQHRAGRVLHHMRHWVVEQREPHRYRSTMGAQTAAQGQPSTAFRRVQWGMHRRHHARSHHTRPHRGAATGACPHTAAPPSRPVERTAAATLPTARAAARLPVAPHSGTAQHFGLTGQRMTAHLPSSHQERMPQLPRELGCSTHWQGRQLEHLRHPHVPTPERQLQHH